MQIYIIYAIGIATVILIGLRIFQHLKMPKEKTCRGCEGCPLKDVSGCSPQNKVKNKGQKAM